MHGDGEQTRDFTYVANVVDGALRASQADTEVSGAVINVATGTRISLNDLFHTLKGITGSTVEPVYGPVRAGDVRDSLADISQGAAPARVHTPRAPRGRPARDRRLVRIHTAARVIRHAA